jgi:hypothetical protein
MTQIRSPRWRWRSGGAGLVPTAVATRRRTRTRRGVGVVDDRARDGGERKGLSRVTPGAWKVDFPFQAPKNSPCGGVSSR